MATVYVGTNTDPHRASFWLAPPEGRLGPAEGLRAPSTTYVLTHRAGRLRVAGSSHPRPNDGSQSRDRTLTIPERAGISTWRIAPRDR
jgi:hypothetical protein